MKRNTMFAVLMAIICQVNAQIIYVREGATGLGNSWENATGNLAQAILGALPGTEIWVAQGTYFPTTDTDRSKSFTIPSDVVLLGGFNGSETSAEERNPKNYSTILSGNIGLPGVTDNSYNVVSFKTVSHQTVLDGFVITGGNANGNVEEGSRFRSGGGIFNDGANGSSNPTIRNCTLTNNYAREGAGVYNNAQGGECSPLFVDCTFIKNEAGLDGGAVYNDSGKNGLCNPSFVNCLFELNFGTYGGAICNSSNNGSCTLVLQNCTFLNNAAYLRGGAVFSLNGDERCFLDITNCSFTGNYPDDQNMIFVSNLGRTKAYKITRSTP